MCCAGNICEGVACVNDVGSACLRGFGGDSDMLPLLGAARGRWPPESGVERPEACAKSLRLGVERVKFGV